MDKVMSSDSMEIIPDLNLPVMVCEFNTHQTEVPAQDAFDAFMATVSRDVDHANGVADVAGAIVPAEAVKVLFEKHMDLWEDAESFEAFRKMPQKPHFGPLKALKEICREGKALGHMVTFDTIAGNTLNLRPDTKREAIVEDLSILEELKTYGFDVEKLKDRLNRMLLLKDQQEKLENMSKQKKRRLTEFDEEKCKVKEKGAEIEEKIRELMKEAELASEMEKNMDAKIASEQLAEKDIGEELRSTNVQIEELVASPFCPTSCF